MFLGHLVDACISAFKRNVLPPLSQQLNLVNVDAEVVGKKGFCWLSGKI